MLSYLKSIIGEDFDDDVIDEYDEDDYLDPEEVNIEDVDFRELMVDNINESSSVNNSESLSSMTINESSSIINNGESLMKITGGDSSVENTNEIIADDDDNDYSSMKELVDSISEQPLMKNNDETSSVKELMENNDDDNDDLSLTIPDNDTISYDEIIIGADRENLKLDLEKVNVIVVLGTILDKSFYETLKSSNVNYDDVSRLNRVLKGGFWKSLPNEYVSDSKRKDLFTRYVANGIRNKVVIVKLNKYNDYDVKEFLKSFETSKTNFIYINLSFDVLVSLCSNYDIKEWLLYSIKHYYKTTTDKSALALERKWFEDRKHLFESAGDMNKHLEIFNKKDIVHFIPDLGIKFNQTINV